MCNLDEFWSLCFSSIILYDVQDEFTIPHPAPVTTGYCSTKSYKRREEKKLMLLVPS
jgi:hypothetical protein